MYKKIIGLLIVLLLFISIPLSVSATFDFTYDGVDYKLADLPLKSSGDEIVIIRSSNGSWFRFLGFSADHDYYINSAGNFSINYVKGSNLYTAIIQNINVSNKWINYEDWTDREGAGVAVPLSGYSVIYTSVDLKDSSGNIVYPASSDFNPALPHFLTSDEDLCSGNFDPLRIDAR